MSEPAWVALGVQGGVVDWEGGWNAGTAYVPGDVVRFNGIDYIAVNPSTGQSPFAATPVIGGREIAYAELTANTNVTVTTEATAVSLIAAPATVFDGSPILIECFFPFAFSPASPNVSLLLTLWEDGVSLGTIAQVQNVATTYFMGVPVRGSRRRTPAAGSHTYAIRAHISAAGSGGVYATAGGPGVLLPAYIRITLEQPAALNITTRAINPGYGTSLPASPVDGDEYTLVDSLTAPTYAWRFRYVAGVADANRWVFIGGSPAYAYVETAETLASPLSTWSNLTTQGPLFTVPRAGVYRVAFSAVVNGTAVGQLQTVGIAVGDTTALEPVGPIFCAANGHTVMASGEIDTGAVTASSVLKMRYMTSAATGSYKKRQISVTPVRVA